MVVSSTVGKRIYGKYREKTNKKGRGKREIGGSGGGKKHGKTLPVKNQFLLPAKQRPVKRLSGKGGG